MPTVKKSIAYRRRGAAATLTLNGSIGMFEAEAFHESASKALADTPAKTVTIDLAGAERLDISALQILHALRRDLAQNGRATVISEPTERTLADAIAAGMPL
ncbi:MAG: STAS domain-containing protein [Capsulimonas sp.]|uniref:STAS domain-containing protein n=1 Tax=Capsulimonas sp. TaxID=2494211 RepID=UPI003265ACCF